MTNLSDITDQALLTAMVTTDGLAGMVAGAKELDAVQTTTKLLEAEAKARWGENAIENLSDYWMATRASLTDRMAEAANESLMLTGKATGDTL